MSPSRHYMSMIDQSTPKKITMLLGCEVYSTNGVFVGVIEDLRLDLNNLEVTGLVLDHVNEELFKGRIRPGQGVIVPYRLVHEVGDIILLPEAIERLPESREDKTAV